MGKISIILPTNREGGLNITFSALKGQTLPSDEWELILIDDYANREELAFRLAKENNVKNFKYLKSKPNYWRANRLIANARNTGLIYASNPLIVFVDDYIWFPPKFLEEHWKVYETTNGKYTLIGPSKAVKYDPDKIEHIPKLPAPNISEKDYLKKLINEGRPITPEQLKRIMEVREFGVTDTRGGKEVMDCPGSWFYCMNASAPLSKIVEINGFDEEFDLTSEEDIDLGLRLQRVGCKFLYRPHYNCTIFHMEHGGVAVAPPRYKQVSYDEMRRRGTLESNLDEVQLVLKEKYGTEYDGSWGLHERNRGKPPLANVGIFDLRAERKNV